MLSGAQSLPLNAFFPVRDAAVLERLPVEARKSVRVANLRAYQINDYGRLPVKFRGAAAGPGAVLRWRADGVGPLAESSGLGGDRPDRGPGEHVEGTHAETSWRLQVRGPTA